MKKAIFTIALVSALLPGFAQKETGSLTFTPKIGVNLANVGGDDLYFMGYSTANQKLDPKMRIGVVAGIEGEYQISKPVSLTAELLYSLQGHTYDDIEVQKNYSATLHYVNVPVMLNLYVVKGLALKAGVQPGYAFYKKISYDQFINNTWNSYSFSGTYYNSFDVSIPVGLSYNIGKAKVDARYNFGLTNLNKLDGGKFSNRVIQVTVGYQL